MIVIAEKVLPGSGMGPVGEDSAAPRQGGNDPDAGWKGVRPGVRLKTGLRAGRSPKNTSVLKPSFISQRQTEEPPNIWDTSGISGNVFAHPKTSSSAP